MNIELDWLKREIVRIIHRGFHTEDKDNGSDKANGDYAALERFLPTLWKASGHSISKFQQMIANDSNLSKHFDINHQAVVAVMAAEAA